MTTQQIKYFLVLAEELHFWKTSEKVYTSQSSLSRQIQSLEDELGIQLFERNKRNVKLTEAGQFLKKHWEVLLDDFDRTCKQAKKIDEGTSGAIAIAYPGSISFNFLPQLLENLNHEMPDLKTELTEPTDVTQEELLLNYKVDIAFSRDAIQNPTISSRKLYAEPVCLVVPQNHWLREDNFNDFRDLKDEKFIISGLHHTTHFASLLRSIFNTYDFEPKTSIKSDFGGMILNLVSNGLGISILPYSFQSAINNKLRFIKLSEEVDLFVNWRSDDRTQTTKNVINYSIKIGKRFNQFS